MSVYYNEIDPFAAAWLRALMKANQIPDGEVDERSIEIVQPDDLRGFSQCHFFAGIGGWAYALRLADWPDDREVWTGSCPCQPWSMAGSGEGTDDPRHLWPAWFRLIQERRPATVFGEQVASTDGRYWLDLVYVSMEAIDYALAAFDLPAAGAGAPHGRQRLWFVADDDGQGRSRIAAPRLRHRRSHDVGHAHRHDAVRRGVADDVADAARRGLRADRSASRPRGHAEQRGKTGGLGNACGGRLDTRSFRETSPPTTREGQRQFRIDDTSRLGGDATFWSDADWIPCSDGKARPVEPGSFPLAHGVPARVGRLRGYGNAIVPQVAQAFIESYLEIA